ncbi:fumarylacetoacetase [Bradyrhizobium sp. KB893862 SZCCT0404]|uniref:fumarylacetoacetase n=1 Tax=Bradyrhizobium sp. KB893862 SZCCT0404 TaxID=2807672 RepID=UPI001BAD0E25|nr:fumarylacetoacetase [Bradyrhizobium sp. KB893862 SZCCT0404]MBR1175299.1 fumarylacetoacetase [Bradyrhizobium sp. KB893862 SZCCT0404]
MQSTNDLDQTHNPALRSWVESANDAECSFPIQNLPIAVLRRAGSGEQFRAGTAIGDSVLDLSAPCLLPQLSEAGRAAIRLTFASSLNDFMAAGRPAQRALRQDLSRILRHDFAEKDRISEALIAADEVEFNMPARIGDFSDFYCSIHHATNVGKLFRPENPILPNYRWLPVGYQGRTSSILLSGQSVARPCGQILSAESTNPIYAPCRRLDYEAELGVFVGSGNALGRPVPIDQVDDHLFGVCLLNDWSARDVQSWEYQPLGPFLAKSFATSISPWIVSFDALEPYRRPYRRPAEDPAPLPHLTSASDESRGAIDIKVSVHLLSAAMAARGLAPARLSLSSYADAYWTLSQVVAHQTSNGCNLQPGDLIGTGTISGPSRDSRGCLLELSEGGQSPVSLPSGETRVFLEDGDTVILSACCEADGRARIGFGECRVTIRKPE